MTFVCSRLGIARRVSATCLAVSAAVGLCLASPHARAQDPAALDKAREQFRQAIAAEAADNWGGALSLLRDVAKIKMTPQVRYNIGLCEENLGQLIAALGDYEMALGDAQAANATDVTSVAPGRIEALRARIPKLVVRRSEDSRAATISIDGVRMGDAVVGKEMPVDPGSHLVEASAKGFQPFSQRVEVAEKETKTVEVALVPVEQPGAVPADAAGASSAPASTSADTGTSHKTNIVPYVVGGAGVATLAASGVFFLLRAGAVSDLDGACGADRLHCPPDNQSTIDRGKTYTTLANVTLAVGVVALGTGTVLYFTSQNKRSPSSSASLGLAPVAPGAPAGASFVGRF